MKKGERREKIRERKKMREREKEKEGKEKDGGKENLKEWFFDTFDDNMLSPFFTH